MQLVPATFFAPSFTCPHCGALAQMDWQYVCGDVEHSAPHLTEGKELGWYTATCYACQQDSVWQVNIALGRLIAEAAGDGKMCWPRQRLGRAPSPDMPADVRKDYEEAVAVADTSPRAAAALLRLCVQRLCIHLGEKGKHIDTDIGELVKKGLPPDVQKALDYVRVIGNNAVHPGKLADDELEDAVPFLFDTVEFIVSDRITRPRILNEKFSSLPDTVRASIQQRDA